MDSKPFRVARLIPVRQRTKIKRRLERIARRLSEKGRPFNLELRQLLAEPFEDKRYQVLQPYQKQLVKGMSAYFRSPSFVVRYLPLDDPDLRQAWKHGEARAEKIDRGRAALRRSIRETSVPSGQTILKRMNQFLDFTVELAERARTAGNGEETESDEARDPLKELLDAIARYAGSRRRWGVSMVNGDTPLQRRDLLAQAFNSPLFPEIMVSSAVMGEGIDLHRFCRHVIHHDGSWNPSALEQQTGRLDRIRSWAEFCRRPIQVYQPFIAGGADEKMYRVLRDRERWFQIVMGQTFEFDEAASEEVAARVLLPENLAKQLTFNLARWKSTEQWEG
jgi:hypothetical protein